MRARSTLFFPIFILTLLMAACSKEATVPKENTDATTSTTATEPGVIRFFVFNHLNSGLPNNYPQLAIVSDGKVQAVRDDFQNVVDALDAIATGDEILDDDSKRQEMQTALETLLSKEKMTLESLSAENKKFILLFSFDEELGECPPCTEAFGSLQANSMLGDFRIIKAIAGNRSAD